MGPGATFLFDGLPVDNARTVVAGSIEVVVNEERNTEPSEVTSEFVAITVGGGVVTTGISVAVDDEDVSVNEVEVSEVENGVDDDVLDVGVGVVGVGVDVDVDVGVSVGVDVGVDVGVGVVIEGVDEDIEFEEHEDPKSVVRTVTGTLTVNVAGTIIVVVLPE